MSERRAISMRVKNSQIIDSLLDGIWDLLQGCKGLERYK
jgi:hypothetical protein